MARHVVETIVSVGLGVCLVGGGGCAGPELVQLSWTLDGEPAATVCDVLDAPELELRLRDLTPGTTAAERVSRVPCADGQAELESGVRSELVAELYVGDILYGVGGPTAITVGNQRRDAPASVETEHIDITMARGRLRAHLTVVGEACGTAGVDSFLVKLRKSVGPLDHEVVGGAEEVVVPCIDGAAVFSFEPVEMDAPYEIVASAEAAGQRWTTSDGGAGAGVFIRGVATELSVDLDVVGRP